MADDIPFDELLDFGADEDAVAAYGLRNSAAANAQNIPRSVVHFVSVPPPEIDCNDCDPPLDGYYTVTFDGLSESMAWAAFNGPHTVKFTSGCVWVDITGELTLRWIGNGHFSVELDHAGGENVVWIPLAIDMECNPLHSEYRVSSCVSTTSACTAAVLASTCSVSVSAYSGTWTAGTTFGPWPRLKRAILDLRCGDQTFTLSWSIMRPGTNTTVKNRHGNVIKTNIVEFVDIHAAYNPFPVPTTQQLRGEIAAAFQEWKTLFESVFSPAMGYGGQLTIIFDNNLPGQTDGVEGLGGVSVPSDPNTKYSLDPNLERDALANDPTRVGYFDARPELRDQTAIQAGVGDIRIGVVSLDRPGTLMSTAPYSGFSRAGYLGGRGGDIHIDAGGQIETHIGSDGGTYLNYEDRPLMEYDSRFRIEALTIEDRIASRAVSIKLVVMHEIGHSLGISGIQHPAESPRTPAVINAGPHDTGTSDPDNFPYPPFPLMRNLGDRTVTGGSISDVCALNFDYFFPHGLKGSSWERRSLQEIYGYPFFIGCNDCDPQLVAFYTVTISGLTGTIWEDLNGANYLGYAGGCTWVARTPEEARAGGLEPHPRIRLHYTSGTWVVELSVGGGRGGAIFFTGPSDVCAPPDNYGSHYLCLNAVDGAGCDGLGTTGCIVAPVVDCVSCNDCYTVFSNSLAGVYIVTLAGLEDALTWARWNGEYTLDWQGDDGCRWGAYIPISQGGTIYLDWDTDEETWVVQLWVVASGAPVELTWKGGVLCNPIGNYGSNTGCDANRGDYFCPPSVGNNSCTVSGL